MSGVLNSIEMGDHTFNTQAAAWNSQKLVLITRLKKRVRKGNKVVSLEKEEGRRLKRGGVCQHFGGKRKGVQGSGDGPLCWESAFRGATADGDEALTQADTEVEVAWRTRVVADGFDT